MPSRGKILFVLFKPQSAGNVGSAARAIKNMGFDQLRLVAPEASRPEDARVMAVHAADVVASARTYPDLSSAVADCSVTVGTTCRSGPYRAAARPIREAASELNRLSESNSIAIIFGPEDRGLTNRELKLCHRLVTIPTAPEYPSLNLAQAVMVVAYELMMAAQAQVPVSDPGAREFVSATAADAMLERMAEALVSIGFLPEDNPDHVMFTMREIFGRRGLTAREVEILNGMARQIRWAASGGHRTLAEKRSSGRKLR
jgi:tRNA/rRNA methyltransferase